MTTKAASDLSPAALEALHKFAQFGGHGFGEYAYLPRPTAKALARRGLVKLGVTYRRDRPMKLGVATADGFKVLRDADFAGMGRYSDAELDARAARTLSLAVEAGFVPMDV